MRGRLKSQRRLLVRSRKKRFPVPHSCSWWESRVSPPRSRPVVQRPPWVYASECVVNRLALALTAWVRRRSSTGADAGGRQLWTSSGHGAVQPDSQIVLCLLSRQALDEARWLDLLDFRLRRAIAQCMSLLTTENDACRLCFIEADSSGPGHRTSTAALSSCSS